MSIPSKLPWDADVAGSWTLSLMGRIPTTFLYQQKTATGGIPCIPCCFQMFFIYLFF